MLGTRQELDDERRWESPVTADEITASGKCVLFAVQGRSSVKVPDERLAGAVCLCPGDQVCGVY